LVLVKATDAAGALLALRGAVVIGSFGFDFLAATSVDGRKNYASNVALHHLLDVLTTRGVTAYDFGGVDYHANKGVYDFKHGAGGTEHSYVGEFEMVKPRILRSFISTMVASRLPK
jgi:lipid II:glycine glycyltransferase (peptidoglycan interpeptide bridge formation enzyme)